MDKGVLYDFAGFQIDTEQRCLMRDGDYVSLTPKAFDTLLVLVENKGKVISKDTLLDEVWKDTFVEESTLAQNISTLRKTFAKYDEATDFIVTIPRRGYRFVADVSEIAADEEVLLVEKRSVTHIVAEQEEVAQAETTSGSPFKWLLAVPVALLLAAVGFLGWSYLQKDASFYQSKLLRPQMATLFSGEDISRISVSPNGKYLAILEKNPEGDSIKLRQISSGNALALVEKSDLLVVGMLFSPNSDSIYYSAYKRSEPFPKYGNLYKIPILGGPPEVIAKDVDSPVSFSPDLKRMAFVRDKLDEAESVVIVSDIDGSNEKELAKRVLFNSFEKSGVSWSPDGKTIAVSARERKDFDKPMKLLAIDVASGETKELPGRGWNWVGHTTWLKDGSGLAVVAYDVASPNLTDEAWFVSYPEGESRQVTAGLSGINGIGVTDDAAVLIAAKSNRFTKRSYIDLEEPSEETVFSKSVSEEALMSLGAVWRSDNQLVYSRTQNQNADIWTMDIESDSQKQLTNNKAADFDPVVSPDGKKIYFRSNRTGKQTIWKMDPDGANQKEIVDLQYASRPTVSKDPSKIFFSAVPERSLYSVIMSSDGEGKNQERITDYRSFLPKVSPDGKYVLCYAVKGGESGFDPKIPMHLSLISTETGELIEQFERMSREYRVLFEWKNDSKGFYFVKSDGKSSVLSERDLKGEKAREIKKWDNESVFQIALTEDGKRMFIEKGEVVVSALKFED